MSQLQKFHDALEKFETALTEAAGVKAAAESGADTIGLQAEVAAAIGKITARLQKPVTQAAVSLIPADVIAQQQQELADQKARSVGDIVAATMLALELPDGTTPRARALITAAVTAAAERHIK